MPTFSYRAYGRRGELAEGTIDASSEHTAADLLWTQGLTAFQMRSTDRAATPWWRRELFSGHGASRSDLAIFTREFATLNSAGIPLDETLRILSEQTALKGIRFLAQELLPRVLNGSALSDAMANQPKIFTADYISMVRAGEIGGNVGLVLEELAALLEKRLEIRAQVQSALFYPAILLLLSMVSLAIIVGVLVPSIAPLFAESGKSAPDAIRLLIALHSKWPQILIGLVAAAIFASGGATVALRRPDARLAYDRVKLKVPLLGEFILKQETARFARTLGTLLKAGVPLLPASSSARTVLSNRHIDAGMGKAIDAVREGTALHRALESATALSPVALRMISVGEKSGTLDGMLLRVAAMFDLQIRRGIDRFMTILTPVMTLMIATLVGGLILTVMSAILSLNDLALR